MLVVKGLVPTIFKNVFDVPVVPPQGGCPDWLFPLEAMGLGPDPGGVKFKLYCYFSCVQKPNVEI
jgi:hypothetical protein